MPSEDSVRRELEPRAKQISENKGWEFGDFIGAGATAATFEVTTPEGLRALKVYSPRFLKGKRGQQVRRRFFLVLENLRGHNCPYLISVHEGGELGDVLFMLMDRAPGSCLARVLKSIPPGNIREIVRQVATAAKFLEEKGLCHRDIKADNIVISQDFTNAVLLDLGVMRWLDEEGTSGTDQGGQLPFIATAQYSSPEYMFLLIKPGPDLWRALTFYQLGGLLHDLIMKERLFEAVVQRSGENRYLIAHAVASETPVIINDGSIPLDLVLLAQRSLEKDAGRRLALVEWSDYLGNDKSRQNEVILGLRSGQTLVQAPTANVVPNWARAVEDALDKRLIESGIHCKHDVKVISHERAFLELSWAPDVIILPDDSEIIVKVELLEKNSQVVVNISSALRVHNKEIAKQEPKGLITLPVHQGEQYPNILIDHTRDGFIALSAQMVTEYSKIKAGESEK